MTKATLKHVANQYILIVDERPELLDWFYDIKHKTINKNTFTQIEIPDTWDKIIAAENLDDVKGIKYKLDDRLTIYQKGDVIMRSIDTEIEVIEEENYWVVRL